VKQHERLEYSRVRNEIIKAIRRDLIGPPHDEIDVITETPSSSYLTGILHPLDKDEEDEEIGIDEEALSESGMLVERGNLNPEFSIGEEEDSEAEIKPKRKKMKKQSSIGIRFYVNENASFHICIKWGEYLSSKKKDEKTGRDIKTWTRKTTELSLLVNLRQIETSPIEVADNIFLQLIKKPIENTRNYTVAIFLQNRRTNSNAALYQVEMELEGTNGNQVFLSENFAREEKDASRFDEFIYRNKPVFSKGFGCAADWKNWNNNYAGKLLIDFLPTHEVASMSTELPADKYEDELPVNLLSIKQLSEIKEPEQLVYRLSNLAERYERWIGELSIEDLNNPDSRKIAESNIDECKRCLERIRDGISLIRKKEVFQAFIFMNKAMHMQNAMKSFSKGKGLLEDELEKEYFSWRPFQLAFILMNLRGIVDPYSADRKFVDLLWFPTGGGKTEAYLGIAAFLLGYRRLTHNPDDDYSKDGGVTIFLRYTLRLLTTQQRDRLMRMICACEIIRARDSKREFGESEFSVGFWVGGQVTVNKFEDLQATTGRGWKREPRDVKKHYSNLEKQVIECPCCGSKKLEHRILPSRDVYEQKIGYEIYCTNDRCYFSERSIPVYLIDEDIYRKVPTVIISTVDKFARLPWDEKVGTLFGRVNRKCEKCGYIGTGEEHETRHNNPPKQVHMVKPFYPPELIIQDELHLITGPLGTIYGAYETAVEELCSFKVEDKKIKPKYIVSTATIKNAEEQVEKIYGRNKMQQFPPSGLSVENSFFAQEIPIDNNPFRLYAGICVSGQSMKTVLLRIYAILLQFTETYKDNPAYAPYLDPYRTLIGYYNSIRELGGAVRLLDDDIPKRIQTIVDKYGYGSRRYINVSQREELTSRVASYKIPKILADLERTMGNKELAVVLATNMIAVGMDVDRLGMMVVTGQPKMTAEYIQATSRIGRKYPGLAITVYNPYRPRDMSHYQNFKAYHSRLYQYVEGTTATPYASRARDRCLHALAVSVLRQSKSELATDEKAGNIKGLDLTELKDLIKERTEVVEHRNVDVTIQELEQFLGKWQYLAERDNGVVYWKSDKRLGQKNRLLRRLSDNPQGEHERLTMDSMRSIEQTSKLYIQDDWWE
jgi:ribosomal protein L32